jgi:hypothetical protein
MNNADTFLAAADATLGGGECVTRQQREDKCLGEGIKSADFKNQK